MEIPSEGSRLHNDDLILDCPTTTIPVEVINIGASDQEFRNPFLKILASRLKTSQGGRRAFEDIFMSPESVNCIDP